MIGYCTLCEEGRGVTTAYAGMGGLPVLELRVRRGRWEEHRLKRGCGRLRAEGVRRVLTGESFPHWPLIRAQGLEPVDPAPLLLRLSARLALERLRALHIPPERATVVLRGRKAEQLRPAAEALCPKVGGLVLDAPDSEGLGRFLRRNFGMAPLTAEEGALELCFAPGCARGGPALEFWPGAPLPRGLRLFLPGLPEGAVCQSFPLLEALWETGRLNLNELEGPIVN